MKVSPVGRYRNVTCSARVKHGNRAFRDELQRAGMTGDLQADQGSRTVAPTGSGGAWPVIRERVLITIVREGSRRRNVTRVILRYSEGSGSPAKEPDPSEYLRMTILA